MMIDDQISNSLPGILRKNLFRRLSHYTLIHSKDEPEQKTTIGWEKSQDTWPRYERPRSFSLPTLAGKTLLSNASSSIKTFKLRKLSSQESIVKITITADKKMSSSSSRVDGIRRSVISLLSKNIDVRPVKLLGGRRLRKNFFGRRRNAICAELDSDIPLITAKMKFERIKSNTKNPFSYLRKWLCIWNHRGWLDVPMHPFNFDWGASSMTQFLLRSSLNFEWFMPPINLPPLKIYVAMLTYIHRLLYELDILLHQKTVPDYVSASNLWSCKSVCPSN